MTITFSDGTSTSTAAEQTLSDTTANEQFAFYLFTHNMTSFSSLRVRVYVKDQNAATTRVYSDETLSGVQASPAYYVAPVITKQFKVTIQRIAGSDKDYTWQRIEIS